jgi:iron complex outermembrane receptor protein
MACRRGASARITAVVLVSLLTTTAHAATLSGRIVDAQTGKAVTAATVRIAGTPIATVSDDSGSFSISNAPDSGITLAITHLAYRPWRRAIAAGGEIGEIRMEPIVLQGQGVVVTGTRAVRGQSPVAFDNITQEQIRRDHYAQDVPMLLTESPGVYAYSDNGNGIGYSYLWIRGFPQRRVSVLVNGVPLNDPESHEVYWIDLPDLPENLQDVQIQRGVGTTLYGSNSIGGTINVLTHYLSPQRSIDVSSGFGSYDTRKFSVGLNSGLIDGRHAVYARFSRIVSDGYRDNAWTDLWSYFLSAARFDEKWTNRINIFGGPEQTHLAYKGLPRRYIDGDPTYEFNGRYPSSDPDSNRQYNPFEWKGETDNFNQPQYQWLTEYHPDSNWHFENTAYYIKGKGFYDQLRNGSLLEEYHLPAVTFPGTDSEATTADQLWRRLWVENDFWGLVPRLTHKHTNGQFSVGAEINRLTASHWAEVQSVSPAPPGFVPGQRYYDYDGAKTVLTGFLEEIYNPDPKVSVTGAMQYSFKRYELKNDRFPNMLGQRVQHSTDYNFLSPRAGITVRPTRELSVFGSVSYNAQEPTNDEVFDAADYYANAGDFFRDTSTNVQGILIGSHPLLKPEHLMDYELGASISNPRWRAEVSLYHMRFHDEIVYNGQINDQGVPIRTNAPSSIHQGIELSAAMKPAKGLTFEGNASFSDNHFDKFTEYVPDYANWVDVLPIDTVDRSGNTLANFPEQLVNLRLTYEIKYGSLSAHVFHAGRLFVDNSNDRAASIDPYTLLELRGAVKLDALAGWHGMELYVQVNNVLDREYESGGYVDDPGPLFIPAAKRNFFVGLRTRL